MRPAQSLLALILCSLLLIGCSSSTTSPIIYYLINPETAAGNSQNPELVIEILDLHLPQYLERFQIVTRSENNQLTFSDSHQWAENLRKNLMRVMSANLGTRLGTVDIGTPIRRTSSRVDYRVQIYLDTFEQQANGIVELKARWQITDADKGNTLHTAQQTFSSSSVAAGNFSEVVSLMSALYGDLGEAIADDLTRLNEEPDR